MTNPSKGIICVYIYIRIFRYVFFLSLYCPALFTIRKQHFPNVGLNPTSKPAGRGCGVRRRCAPVGAPGDGGNKAHIGEEDGVVLDAVQGVVHLTQRQPVQLELQLHLQPFKQQSGQSGRAGLTEAF